MEWTKMSEKMDHVTQNTSHISSFLKTKKSYGTNQYHCLGNGKDSFEKEAYPNEERKTNEKGDESPRISTLQACWNILNLIQGTGTLGIPFAVSQGGYLSLAAITVVPLITSYTGKLIIECLYEKPVSQQQSRGKRLRNSYALTGKACWEKHGAAVVYVAQVMQLSCACVLYLLLVANFFNGLFERRVLSYSTCIIISGCLLLPSLFFNQLKYISWFSMFSVTVLLVVFISVIGYGVTHRHDWEFELGVTTLHGFPVSWGIILFSFVCHPYLPAIEENMEEPEQFNSAMNYSFSISTLVKLVFGLIAVLTFRNDTRQQIAENLPAGILQNTANCLLGLNGLFSYALPLFTLTNVVHKSRIPCLSPCYPEEDRPLTVKERGIIYLKRSLFVAFTTSVALAFPQFSLLMAVIGSVSGVLLTLVFPCLFDIILNRDYVRTHRYAANLVIIFVGVLSGVTGLAFSIMALVRMYLQ